MILEGTTIGVVTDADGMYCISIPGSGGTMVLSLIGMVTAKVEVGSRLVLDVQMDPDIKQLSAALVVGTEQCLKRNSLVSANISAELIAKLPSLSVNQALKCLAAGVMVTSNSGHQVVAGRVSYAFMEKYLASFYVRRDRSS